MKKTQALQIVLQSALTEKEEAKLVYTQYGVPKVLTLKRNNDLFMAEISNMTSGHKEVYAVSANTDNVVAYLSKRIIKTTIPTLMKQVDVCE